MERSRKETMVLSGDGVEGGGGGGSIDRLGSLTLSSVSGEGVLPCLRVVVCQSSPEGKSSSVIVRSCPKSEMVAVPELVATMMTTNPYVHNCHTNALLSFSLTTAA